MWAGEVLSGKFAIARRSRCGNAALSRVVPPIGQRPVHPYTRKSALITIHIANMMGSTTGGTSQDFICAPSALDWEHTPLSAAFAWLLGFSYGRHPGRKPLEPCHLSVQAAKFPVDRKWE